MTTTLWICIVLGTLIFTTLFELLFKFIFYLFSDKTTTDFAELSRIKWWEHSRILRECYYFFNHLKYKTKSSKPRAIQKETKPRMDPKIYFDEDIPVRFVSVGQIIDALKPMLKEHSDYDIMFWGHKHLPCYPTRIAIDKNGRLCLWLLDDDGLNYNVADIYRELQNFDRSTEVYVAARGYFLNIVRRRKTLFFEDKDCSDNDVIACITTKIGEYDEDA